MYEVILIDKDTDEKIGDIGKYNDFDEAMYQKNDYNRKADRHRGYATIQAILGEETVTRPKRIGGIRLNSNPQPIHRSERNLNNHNPRVHHSSSIHPTQRISMRRNDEHYERQRPQYNEHVRHSFTTSPKVEEKKSDFVCLYDTRKKRAYVLANKHLTTFLYANPYQEKIGEGSMFEMIKLRDEKNRK